MKSEEVIKKMLKHCKQAEKEFVKAKEYHLAIKENTWISAMNYVLMN